MKFFIYLQHTFQVLDPIWKVDSLIVFVILLGILRKFSIYSVRQSILVSALSAYLFLVISATVFSRPPGIKRGIELNLLRNINDIVSGDFSVQMEALKNIAMLFPLGMLMSFLDKYTERNTLFNISMAGLFVSLIIEVTQFFFSLGLSELLDVVCNTMGMVIGWLIGRLIIYLSKKMRAF